MTIDELCAVIRKRRQRTGLAWVADAGSDHDIIREQTGCCPIIAAAAETLEHGGNIADGFFNQCAGIVGVRRLKMNEHDAYAVIEAADGEETEVRAKLEAACLGPLE